MILKMFSIFDLKANSYNNPLFMRRTEEAIRAFEISANNPESDYFKYAEDYVLAEIGTFNDENGQILTLASPLHLMTAREASIQHREYYAKTKLEILNAS